jgi:hypothetical protein
MSGILVEFADDESPEEAQAKMERIAAWLRAHPWHPLSSWMLPPGERHWLDRTPAPGREAGRTKEETQP